LLYAIAVDVTKVDSREAWWNQSTLHGMAQRCGGVRELSIAWHRDLVGSIRSLRHGAQRPGGVRELSMAWLNFHVV